MARNTATALAAIKLGVFTVVSILVTGTLAMIMGHFDLGGQTEYKAVFSNASELTSGDDVRIAGVTVGEVKKVQIYDRSQALVTFKVANNVPLTTASHADVRFLNLVGDRYMSLSQGRPGAQALPSGGTLPVSHTTPALNLSALFNGFQPLFAALTPRDVNKLSLNIVRVLQGEGGTIQGLLANTASLTNGLADRDKLIGQVITNLSSLLQTVNDRHQQLNTLVIQLKDWLTHLATDRNTIGDSVTNLSALSKQVADLLTQSRPYLKGDVAQLRRVMTLLNTKESKQVLSETLKRLPSLFAKQVRVGSYGSWYNYYLCDFSGKILLPTNLPNVPGLAQIQQQLSNLSFHSNAKRCQ